MQRADRGILVKRTVFTADVKEDPEGFSCRVVENINTTAPELAWPPSSYSKLNYSRCLHVHAHVQYF